MDFTTVTTIDIPEGRVSTISCNGKIIWQCGVPLGGLAIGATVYVEENSGKVPYIVVAHDYLKTGTTTLLRRDTVSGSQFWASEPYSQYNNMYYGSALEKAMASFWANNMPLKSSNLFKLVDVPVRENAYSGCSEITVLANMFPLSTQELTGDGSTKEGSYLPYFENGGTLTAMQNSTTTSQYWTRSVRGGYSDYARAVGSGGSITNVLVTNSCDLRPAGCVSSETLVVKIAGVYYIL